MKKETKKPIKSPVKTTKAGNKCFEGAKDGKPYKKGVKKTEEEKQAMRDGWARRRVYEELLQKVTTNLGLRLDDDTIQSKDLIDAMEVLVKALGDNVVKQEITGDVNMSPTTFNILPVKSKDEL